MDTLPNVNNSPLNQPSHCNRFIQSPLKVILVAIGIILIIGSAIAAGLLYSNLSALSCLIAVPIGIALIVYAVRCAKQEVTHPLTNPLTTRLMDIIKHDHTLECKFFTECKIADDDWHVHDFVLRNKKNIENLGPDFINNMRSLQVNVMSLGLLLRTTRKTFDFYLFTIRIDAANIDSIELKLMDVDTSLARVDTYLHNMQGVTRLTTQWNDVTGFSG